MALPVVQPGICPEALGSCALSSPRGYVAASVFRPQPDRFTPRPELGSLSLSAPRASGAAAELLGLLEALLSKAVRLDLLPGSRVPVRIAHVRLEEGEDPFVWLTAACVAALLHSGIPMRGMLAPASGGGCRKCFLVSGRKVELRGGKAVKQQEARVEEVYAERGGFGALWRGEGPETEEARQARAEALRASAGELLDHLVSGLL